MIAMTSEHVSRRDLPATRPSAAISRETPFRASPPRSPRSHCTVGDDVPNLGEKYGAAAREPAEAVYYLGYPEELEPLAHCAHNLDGWEKSWGVSFEELSREAIEAAKHFLNKLPTAEN
jgi:hypothetical protein